MPSLLTTRWPLRGGDPPTEAVSAGSLGWSAKALAPLRESLMGLSKLPEVVKEPKRLPSLHLTKACFTYSQQWPCDWLQNWLGDCCCQNDAAQTNSTWQCSGLGLAGFATSHNQARISYRADMVAMRLRVVQTAPRQACSCVVHDRSLSCLGPAI